MKIRCLLLSFLFCSASLFAQYESGVSIPDTSEGIISDLTIPRIKYAHTITSTDLKDHLTIIASDEMGGRELGTEENVKAAEYLKRQLIKLGFDPIESLNSYYQDATFSRARWDVSECKVGEEKFRNLWDYVSFPTESGNLSIDNEQIVFLGYGIHDNRYSDYKGKSLQGKTILIYEGEPQKEDGSYWITGTNDASFWSETANKLKVAKRQGVQNVLIIKNNFKSFIAENRRKAIGTSTKLGNIEKNNIWPNHVYLSSSLAKSITGENTGEVVAAREKINASGKAKSVAFDSDLRLNLKRKLTINKGSNVLGYIKGSSLPDELLVVSAHYDHIGQRGDYIFNGADDNGSGTSTVLELAQAFMEAKKDGHGPKRSILFLWVTGEEKGLLGSQYYAENPVFNLDNTIADVNIDMVGRIDNIYKDNPNYIYVIGSDRISPALHKINENANQKYSQLILDYKYNDEKDPNRFYYRSDHYNFAKHGIPSIFYFNGVHADYHKETDTVDKIHFKKMEKIGRLIFQTVWDLANGDINVRSVGLSSAPKTQP